MLDFEPMLVQCWFNVGFNVGLVALSSLIRACIAFLLKSLLKTDDFGSFPPLGQPGPHLRLSGPIRAAAQCWFNVGFNVGFGPNVGLMLV